MKEYLINMGPEVKVRVKLKIPLKDCLEIIKGGSVTANNFIPFNNFNLFNNIGGGKNKKSKKRRSKTKRRKNSKRKSKKKRSKKLRSRKY